MVLYSYCRACCPSMDEVGLLCYYSLLLLSHYVVVDIVIMMLQTKDSVLNALSTVLVLSVMEVYYSGYISLSVVKVIRRKFDRFRFACLLPWGSKTGSNPGSKNCTNRPPWKFQYKGGSSCTTWLADRVCMIFNFGDRCCLSLYIRRATIGCNFGRSVTWFSAPYIVSVVRRWWWYIFCIWKACCISSCASFIQLVISSMNPSANSSLIVASSEYLSCDVSSI